MTLDISPCKKPFEVRLHSGCSEQAQKSDSVESSYYMHICIIVHKVHWGRHYSRFSNSLRRFFLPKILLSSTFDVLTPMVNVATVLMMISTAMLAFVYELFNQILEVL